MTRLRGPMPVLLLTGFGTLLGLFALEGGARFVAVRQERSEGRMSRDLDGVFGPAPRSTATLGQIIRKSGNPRIVYELRPRLDVIFSGARLTTSDAAHRGPDVTRPKPSSTFRIVGIGDSYLFGQGVSDEETYLARLPGLMPTVADGRKVETVNLGVPGFNTVMEVEILGARFAGLRPDLVLIEIVGNDLDLPNFLWSEVDPWTLHRSFLLDFIRARVARRPPDGGVGIGLTAAPREASAETFLRDADRTPPAYRSMVGLQPFKFALEDLARLGRDHGVPVVAVTHGVWFEPEMVASLQANQIPVLILRSALRQRARSLGATDYARSALALSPTDLHPSAIGHSVIAEELAAWLRTHLES